MCHTPHLPKVRPLWPAEEANATDGPTGKVVEKRRFTRLEYRNGEVEELWDDRIRGMRRSPRKRVGFNTFGVEGFAPGAPAKVKAPGTPRTPVMGPGLEHEHDMPRLERPYRNTGKPSSIPSREWAEKSTNQRREYVEFDRRRILAQAGAN